MRAGKASFDPATRMMGGFSGLDGTVEFFTRINAQLEPNFRVLDLGAGRGMWYFQDECRYRRGLRDIRSKVAEFIGADVDEAVLSNPTTTSNVLIGVDGRIPIADESIDLIICDYVLEHIVDVAAFRAEVGRVLKPGGIFCGRTPHAANYVTWGARLIMNIQHANVLKLVQPERKSVDVFPTAYRCNSLRGLTRLFPDWEHFSYIYTAEPSYYFGSRWAYAAFAVIHKLAPMQLTGNIFAFIRKPARLSMAAAA